MDQLHDLLIGCEPDVTVLIDIDPSLGLDRANGRLGKEKRFEDFGIKLQEQMRTGFLALANQHSDRFRIVDGAGSQDEVATEIRQIVQDKLTAI